MQLHQIIFVKDRVECFTIHTIFSLLFQFARSCSVVANTAAYCSASSASFPLSDKACQQIPVNSRLTLFFYPPKALAADAAENLQYLWKGKGCMHLKLASMAASND